MEIAEIRWKSHFAANGADAEKVHREILRLKQKNQNTVSPKVMVDAARKPTNPMHSLFEWDDSEAAEKYRVSQAQHIMRALQVIYVEAPKQPMRAFEIISKKRPGDSKTVTLYGTSEEACADPDVHARLVADAVRELIAWRNRYQMLNEMRNLVRVIDKVVDELTV